MPIPQLKIKSPQTWRQKQYQFSNNNQLGRDKNQGNAPRNNRDQKKLLKDFFYLACAGFIFAIAAVFWLSRGLPDPNRLIDRHIAQSTKIYDRTGQTVLYEISGEQKRTFVSLKDMPDFVKNATIAIEDKDFYKHSGFSIWAIFRTIVTDLLFGRKAGGSTLTQQFIKNAILTNEKTITRKIKEIILAYRLEQKFSKDEILQMYLNEIPYGSTAYGVDAASQRYFGKSVRDIRLPEAAILAALIQAPSHYSPYGPNKNQLIARQHYILDLMAKQGYITPAQATAAKNTKLTFIEPADNIIAPHFVMYVKGLLADKYGEQMIEQEGLKIYTTLDLTKQKIAEEVIQKRAEINKTKYQASNAALVSIDAATGQILAMVGSKNYFDNTIDGQVNVALQPRQPGSSFKPIVYTTAFIKGYTPNTVLYDVVTNFSTDPNNPYIPHNYDNKEHGPVTMKKALAGSLNIPAVKTIYLTGINNVISLAKNLGYTTLTNPDRYGLSLVLGGGEVKLIDHVDAYSAFAQEGKLHPLSVILKVEDKDGKVIEEYKNKESQALEPEITRLITSILSDNSARAYIFGEKNFLTLGSRPVAAKTGTTNDYRDAWTIGYTPSLVTGVWAGNNDNSSMKRGADGSVVAAPIWHDYMQRALQGTPIENFNKPQDIKTGNPILDGNLNGTAAVKIDKYTGFLATNNTPLNFIIEKIYTQAHSILYYVNKNNPRGDQPANPADDPQYLLWENAITAWVKKQNIATSSPPVAYDNVHLSENKPTFTITQPLDNQILSDPIINIAIQATAPRGINRAEYYIDNKFLDKIINYPFGLNKNIGFLNNGFHSLMVRVCDDVDNCSEQKINFDLKTSLPAVNQNISISWNKPQTSEISLSDKDFPYLFSLNLNNNEQIAEVQFFLTSNQNKKNTAIIPVTNSNNGLLQYSLETALAPGNYIISAQANGWNGQTAQSNEIQLNVINNSANATSTNQSN